MPAANATLPPSGRMRFLVRAPQGDAEASAPVSYEVCKARALWPDGRMHGAMSWRDARLEDWRGIRTPSAFVGRRALP